MLSVLQARTEIAWPTTQTSCWPLPIGGRLAGCAVVQSTVQLLEPEVGDRADRVAAVDQGLDHGQSGDVLLAVEAAALGCAPWLDHLVSPLPDPQGVGRYPGQACHGADAVGAARVF